MANKLFNGVDARLCIDQWGEREWARTVKELCEKCDRKRAAKMYRDKTKGTHAGKAVHCGYIVGRRWFTIYAVCEVVYR